MQKNAGLILTLVFGVLLAIGGSLMVREWEVERAREQFARAVVQHEVIFLQRLSSTFEAVESINAFYAASEEVTRDEFRDFTKFGLDHRHAIQALEWIPRVRAADRAAFEAAARKDGLEGFTFTERQARGQMVPAGDRDVYFPVYFVEPLRGNKAALGFDLGSSPARRAALEKARDSGKMVATERITLIQETEKSFGFLVFQPIYHNGTKTDTVEDRRQNLRGFALGVLRVNSFAGMPASTADGPAEKMNIFIFDQSAPAARQLLYPATAPFKTQGEVVSADCVTISIKVGGRDWNVAHCPKNSGVLLSERRQSLFVLFLGLLVTGITAAYIRAMKKVEFAQEQAVRDSESRLHSVLDNIVDGIVTIDERGTVEFFGPSAERIFGYRAEEVIGRNVNILMPEPYHGEHDTYIANYLETGEAKIIGIGREVIGRRKDGSSFPMELGISEVNQEGRPLFTGILRDITKRKHAEKELARKQAQLQVALDNMPGGIVMVDEDLNFVLVNRHYTELYDFPDNLIAEGNPIIDMIHFQAQRGDYGEMRLVDAVNQMIGRITDGQHHVYEQRLKNGRIYEVSIEPTPDGGVVAVVTNITERKHAEAELTRKEEQFRIALDNMPSGIRLIDKDWNYVLFNSQYLKLYDFPEGLLKVGESIRVENLYQAQRGDHGPGDPEELTDKWFAEWKGPTETSNWERKTVGGKILQVNTSPTPGGGIVNIVSDITERKHAEKELAEKEAHLRVVLDNMPGGIRCFDKEYKLVFFNSRYSELWDLPDGLLKIGDSLRVENTYLAERGDYGDGDIEELVDGVISALPFKAEPQHYERTTLKGRFLDCRTRPTELGGFVSVHTDITKRKQAEEALREARNKAEEATKAKASFLATMSHEIRTPMTGVIGMVDMLVHTKLDDDQRQMMRTVRDSAYALLTIINDILDFSKIEAGKLELEAVPFSMRDTLEGMAETLGPNANNKGIRINIHVDPEIPDAVLGDQVRIRQILFNIGGNAVKFTEKGRVLIRAFRVPSGDKKNATVRFEVIDSGIGISKEAQADLFTEFSQAESSTTRRFGGTGLGLSICQRLTEMMGGKIEVESEFGEGSTFIVTLTFPIPDDHKIKSDGYDLAGLNVLFLGDDAEERELDAKYLRHWDADVTTFGDIEETKTKALEAANQQQPFDIIVLGSAWPLETRAAHIESMQAEKDLAKTRFVLMTETRTKADLQEITNTIYVGSDPLRRAPFVRAIAVAAGRASPDITYDDEENLSETVKAPTVEEAEAAGTLILVAEDNMTNQNVIRRQLNLLGYAVEMVDDGKQALEAWRSKPYAVLLTDCHMPEMDGFELTQKIRKAEKDDDVRLPIIAITASVLAAEIDRCYEAGMDDSLAKPLEMPKLKATLRKWMPAYNPEEIVDSEEKASDPPDTSVQAKPSDSESPIDPSALKSVFGDDEATFKEILKEFVEPATSNIGEIEASFAERSADGVAKAAHKLKSSSRSVGANDLADLCQTLEEAGKAEDWDQIDIAAPRLAGVMQQVTEYIEAL